MAHGYRVLMCVIAAVGLSAAGGVMASTAPKTKETSMESAKRRAPQAKPVVHKGVRYEQLRDATSHGFDQGGGIVAAVDVASGKRLWAVQLYKVVFDPKEERDAQEIYIEELKVDAKANALLVRDERGRRYTVDLADRAVRETK